MIAQAMVNFNNFEGTQLERDIHNQLSNTDSVQQKSVIKKSKNQSANNQHLSFYMLPEVLLPGWHGPFNGRKLSKLAIGSKLGVGSFNTLEEAIIAADALGDACSGVTYNANCKTGGAYTLRKEFKWCNPAKNVTEEELPKAYERCGLKGRDCSWVKASPDSIGWQNETGHKWD